MLADFKIRFLLFSKNKSIIKMTYFIYRSNSVAHKRQIEYVNDATESISTLLRLRLPPLFIGLVLGVLISFLTSRFEEVLKYNIRIAFFLPFIVYMADAVGTQTQSIYARALKSKKARFHLYLIKESVVGLALGLFFAVISGFIAHSWLGDDLLALSVGISMFAAIASAPIVAVIVTQILQALREDPAAGAGPIATVVQDMISIVLYGFICSLVLL